MTSSVVSGISRDAYARIRSCLTVPSSSHTGLPSAFPLMSQSAMSMPLIAWIAIPRRPMKMTPRYILSQSRSTSSGSSPISSSRRLFAIACEAGAWTSAATASGAESTSPMPVIPSSVWTRMTRSSWLPSAIPSFTAGCRRTTASTSVIFTDCRS